MERSQRILQAMKCRGFDGRLYLLDNSRWKPLDSLYLVTACGLIAMLFVLESLL
jgi:cobalt/nickel transport system permease protein